MLCLALKAKHLRVQAREAEERQDPAQVAPSFRALQAEVQWEKPPFQRYLDHLVSDFGGCIRGLKLGQSAWRLRVEDEGS